MNTHVLMLATANHSMRVRSRLLANVEVDPLALTDTAIRTVGQIANEFTLASGLAAERSPRQTQLLERVRVCLDTLADVEQALMLATGDR